MTACLAMLRIGLCLLIDGTRPLLWARPADVDAAWADNTVKPATFKPATLKPTSDDMLVDNNNNNDDEDEDDDKDDKMLLDDSNKPIPSMPIGAAQTAVMKKSAISAASTT